MSLYEKKLRGQKQTDLRVRTLVKECANLKIINQAQKEELEKLRNEKNTIKDTFEIPSGYIVTLYDDGYVKGITPNKKSIYAATNVEIPKHIDNECYKIENNRFVLDEYKLKKLKEII